MNVSKKKLRGGLVITITGELTIYYIKECWHKLKAILDDTEEPVKLNMAKIEDIDTTGLQLLMYLKKYYSEKISGFEQLSSRVQDTLEFTGLKLD